MRQCVAGAAAAEVTGTLHAVGHVWPAVAIGPRGVHTSGREFEICLIIKIASIILISRFSTHLIEKLE